ncbi:2-C-methyl-D-erythritol 4-phosphate cytidylyltransferase [Cellulomonas fimi]|uniref:2-C-methyl-D-erythritol 4-phosphate cytidylyltransferase n=1 Tax=Cellulomonas fimi TaxID=1708 RepID=A0A7Y0QII6_CELFI|nr:2-C-methyl-D-erythritol 4-phosphate cytidylyltransferase [Cellulomonas fimi]NMR20327.1 2-C-methyl-D-erythritol 4-phosphate cytidylyltransferase [Cellulomonas fimi]
MTTAAILTAAGSGTRLGHVLPKALVPLAGEPLVVHAARRLASCGVVDLVVVPAPGDHLAAFESVLSAADLGVPVTVVTGGMSRQASVAAALATVPPDVDVVLVHDAARSLAPSSLAERVVQAVRAGRRAVVPGVPVPDTVVEVGPEGPTAVEDRVPGTVATAGATAELVTGNPDRSVLRSVQTPQGFDRALLDRAHAAGAHRAGDESLAATDDASLVAALGEPVHVVPGDAAAVKITTPRDLALARLLLEEHG